jgi:L-lysine exporter family protein LysE/ArgO
MERIFFEGFFLQASLIFALGAQNLFILESGLKGHYPVVVSLVCFLCDLTLIMLGVAGAGTLFSYFPEIKILFGILGVIFLFTYGWDKFKTQLQSAPSEGSLGPVPNLKRSVLQAMTFSLINPHAYLDGIVLIGGYSSKYASLVERVTLGWGSAIFSLLWFLSLSLTSQRMMPLLENPKRMRVIMGTAGITLMYLSARLSVDVYAWITEIQKHDGAIAFQESLNIMNHF